MSIEPGILYVVATPIGNLGDIAPRALEILGAVDVVAAEDTRRTGALLSHFGISARQVSLHEHNEPRQVPGLIERLRAGGTVALVSDAGTPLISDPGYRLVVAAREAGIRVSPVPGPVAAIAALSISGLPSDRFVFEGFLPAKASARRQRLQALAEDPRTLIFYESSHRIADCLADMRETLGADRRAVVARELTKTFEQIRGGSLDELCNWLAENEDHRKGEFVVLTAGAPEPTGEGVTPEAERILGLLLAELPVKKAAKLAAEITGLGKNQLYARAVGLKSGE
ncbi:16S rRNA (cytidine(1402)-2'-O)-methyltransferase [Thioalkalivibrio denitrificans]|uniref:Ribosomal RNA small subunit methyltransferase I n=1 Tax=Thioalkalivibrio denitrificans TaxID=108003 RepID=A0A1V3NN73_9GAMM|nr:16S rRNA (cytidine(1402)-2'-O)-methyltransferase [Thioalkalivibrio denitrificans]OOG26491.1 16S rRNA (cytidine(1402)-2'-O)-methyltransferase [Thioalkalivibrio denitrificans]